MRFDTGPGAGDVPIGVGAAALVGKGDTPRIPCDRAALRIHETNRVAAGWVDRSRSRVDGKRAAFPGASADSDAQIRGERGTPSIPCDPAAVWFDAADRR